MNSGPDSAERELQELMGEPLSSVYSRERSMYDELASPFSETVVLFGAGGLGRKTLAGLRRIGIEPLAFADNNPQLWGKQVEGLQVFSVEDAAQRFGQRAAFIVTIWKGEATDTMAERQQQLRNLQCARVVPFGFLFWKYPDVFLPHYACDLPHRVYEHAADVQQTLPLWTDEPSRREYLAQLRWRTLLDFDALPRPVAHEIYFPADLVTFLPDEVFVDCGAYDGDTIRALLSSPNPFSGSIVAFEPDPANFLKLQKYVMDLPPSLRQSAVVHAAAVGARRSKVRFEASGTEASAVGTGDTAVDCVTLDETLGDLVPTYIKMDIEGSELDALRGAQRTISANLPVLAVCSYHRQDHLWQIPLLIHSFSDQYRFFLRPHHLEVWDLVCYAIPAHRLRSRA